MTVLDADGEPIEGATVYLSPSHRQRDGRRPATAGWTREGSRCPTQADGTTRLDALDAGSVYRLTVIAPHDRKEVQGRDLDPWSPTDTTVSLDRAYVIRGTVIDRSGAPIEGALVTPKARDPGRFSIEIVESTDAAGRFAFSRKTPADVFLDPRYGVSRGVGQWVAVGRTDVVLVVDRGAPVRVRLEDVPEAGLGGVLVTLRSGEEVDLQPLRERDTVTFQGHDLSMPVSVSVGPTRDGTYGFVSQTLLVGGEVRVRLVPGGTIRGRIQAPAGATYLSARVQSRFHAMSAHGRVDAAGRFEIRGLPDGEWGVEALGYLERVALVGKAHVTTGGYVEVALAPVARGR